MSIAIRTLTAGDLDHAFALKEQAGWNQTRADLLRFQALAPEGWFIAEQDGARAGTVAVFEFGPVAWIAMMLVEKTLRGCGIGRALMEHGLDFAERRGASSIRLDATPLGQPLYEKLGFTADYALTRFGGTARDAFGRPDALPEISVENALQLDRQAVGADRRSLLSALWNERPGFGLMRNGLALGYHTSRPGANATQIGPCVAELEFGADVLRDALTRTAGRLVFVDVPEPNREAMAIAQSAGLSPQRQLLRMTRGLKTTEHVKMIWASSGPEKG